MLKLSDGLVHYTGEVYGGATATLGPSCLLALESTPQGAVPPIRILVSSIRIQCLDLALLRHFGVEPAQTPIICVKSTVHFRADFAPIAGAILNVAAPDALACHLPDVPYKHLRSGVRLGPQGPEMRAPKPDPG